MPVYNGQEFLAQSIESIRDQSYQNWELILLDDASTDISPSICQHYAKLDLRIKFVKREENQGLVAARNSILDMTKGSYLAWNDQDDISYPQRLQIQVKALEQNPTIGVLGSWTHILTVDKNKTSRAVRYLPLSQTEIAPALLFTSCISFNTVIMNTNLVKKSELRFHHSAHFALDYDFWTRAVTRMKLGNLPLVLSSYRVHSRQNSAGTEKQRMADNAWNIQCIYLANALGGVTSEEEKMHRLLGEDISTAAQKFQCLEVANYLLKLYTLNEVRGTYEAKSLRRVLSTKWYLYLKFRSRSHPFDLVAAASQPISGWIPPTALRYLKWKATNTAKNLGSLKFN